MENNKKEVTFFSFDENFVKCFISLIKGVFRLTKLGIKWIVSWLKGPGKIRKLVMSLYYFATIFSLGTGLVGFIEFIETPLRGDSFISKGNLEMAILGLLVCPLILRIICFLLIKRINRREKMNLQISRQFVKQHKTFCPQCQRELREDSAFCDRCATRL